jgi:hypothetical protein
LEGEVDGMVKSMGAMRTGSGEVSQRVMVLLKKTRLALAATPSKEQDVATRPKIN